MGPRLREVGPPRTEGVRDSRNLRPALSAVPVELHGLLVGRHCHEPYRVPISQGRKQLANQRRGDSPAPERERESG